MRRSSLLAALTVASMASLALFSSASFALTGGHAGASARPAKESIYKVHVKFKAEYTDPLFGPISCEETHVASKKYPGTETSGGADKFKCTSTTGEPIPNTTPGEPVAFQEWASDYFYFDLGQSEYVIATEVHAKASHNGMSFKGIAVF